MGAIVGAFIGEIEAASFVLRHIETDAEVKRVTPEELHWMLYLTGRGN